MKFLLVLLACSLALVVAQPTGNADSYGVRQADGVKSLNVLHNDVANNGGTLTVKSIDTTGTLGSVVIAGDSLTIDYTPPAAAFGQTTFTYVATETGGTNDGDTTSVTVTIDIAPEHPDACANYGDYDGTVADGDQCACSQPSSQTDTTSNSLVTLDVSPTASRINNDNLYVVFTEPVKYYYVDGSTHLSRPKYNVPRGAAGTNCAAGNWAWTSQLLDGCKRQWTGVISWNNAYDGTGNDDTGNTGVGCGFTVDRTGENIKFRLDFSVTTTEDLPELDTAEGSQRNDANHPRNRAITHKLPFVVEFPKQATATSGDIVVFSPYRVLTAITKQSVNNDPNVDVSAVTLTGTLFTSVQWPFRLTSASHSATKDNAGTTVSLRTGSTPARYPLTGGVEYDNAAHPADTSATELPANSCDPGTSCDVNAWQDGLEDATCPVCEQTTEFKFKLAAVDGDDVTLGSESGTNYYACDFTGEYALKFVIACHTQEPAASACPLDTIDTDKNNVFVVMNIASSNHCPQVIDTVQFTTDLWTFETSAQALDTANFGDAEQKDDFLDQQLIYFRGKFTTDDVTVSNVEIVEIKLLRPNIAAKNVDAGNFRTASQVIYNGAAVDLGAPANLNVDAVTDARTNNGNADIAPSSEANPTFQITVNRVALGLDVDEREVLQYEITVDITYANAGQAANAPLSRRLLKIRSQNNERRTSAKAVATVGGSASASTSNALFGVSVSQLGMAAGGLAAVAVVSMVVIVGMKKRRQAALAKTEINMVPQSTA